MLKWENNMIFNEAIKKDKIVIFEFTSKNCGACQSIKQKLSSWIQKTGGIKGYYIPVEENLELAAKLGIFSSPVVMVYIQGELTVREAGYFSLEQIQRDILRYKYLLEEK